MKRYNEAIEHQIGIADLLTIVNPPTLESAQALFDNRGVKLLVVTGGPAVARAALAAKKRAIVAGPGNPPVVVDSTACLDKAAASIILGGSFDNNLLCIGEKQVFAVADIFDRLMETMGRQGGFRLNSPQIDALTSAAFVRGNDGHLHVNKDYIGKDPVVLAQAGRTASAGDPASLWRDGVRPSVCRTRADDAVRAVHPCAERRPSDRTGEDFRA